MAQSRARAAAASVEPRPTAGPRLDQRVDDLRVLVGDVAIARYVFRPDATAIEGAKPYLHPLRTLDGAVVSGFRPWDHRWHKGLQMTLSHVSGQNFWGGPTFDVETGYRQRDNVGQIQHRGFTTSSDGGREVLVEEQLVWITQAGQHWLDEKRRHRFHGVDLVRGLWVLDFASELRNVSTEALELGSPTTHGRAEAGYSGWFWRGPRAFTGGSVLTSDHTSAAEAMGSTSPWLAYSGQHDERDGGATLLSFAGSSSADVDLKWFIRTAPFPAMAPSPSFDEEVILAPGDTLTLRHRLVLVDHICQPDEIRALAAELAPAPAGAGPGA